MKLKILLQDTLGFNRHFLSGQLYYRVSESSNHKLSCCKIRSVIMGNIRDTTRLDILIAELLALHEQPDILLSEVAKKIGMTFDADACWLFSGAAIVDDSPVFKWQGSAELDSHISDILRARLNDLDLSLFISDLAAESKDERSMPALLKRSIKSLAIATIKLHGKIFGYIVLTSSHVNNWHSSDRERLAGGLPLLAVAIEKFQTDRKNLSLKHYQNLLPELSNALAKTIEKEQFFPLALSSAAKSLQVELGLVLLLKYDEIPSGKSSKANVPKAKVSLAETWIASDSQYPNASSDNWNLDLQECSLLTKAFQIAPEALVATDKDLAGAKLASLYPQYSNWLIVPLMGQSREADRSTIVLGFLAFQHGKSHIWHQEELALVSWIASLTSTAIVQSQALFQVQNLVEERTAQLQSSLEVQAMLYEKTRQQLEQVRQAKKAREEFIDSISHELRTPLTAMNLAIKMLRQPGITDDRRANYFNILEQQCNQEINLVNDLLDWGRLESKQYEMQVQTVNLRQLLDQLAQSFADKWTQKGLNLEIDLPQSGVDLQTDRDILKRILAELLNNAGKYSLEESTVGIGVNVSYKERQITLTVTNVGSCIPADEIARIFEPLHRPVGTARNAIRGTGLGLALVKSFVQHLHGAIAVSSDAFDGSTACKTCFTLTLPQAVEIL